MVMSITLAVAGAGKTYHICHSIDPAKRNLILAFTHENIFNIQRELIDAFERIPELTKVATFDAFVYRNFVLPYEPSIGAHFGYSNFVSTGITTINPPRKMISTSSKKRVLNPEYVTKDKLFHYVDNKGHYYCATLSELALQVAGDGNSLVKRAVNRLSLFYDSVFIDEFQDFRTHNYDLIVKIAKLLSEITLVGDYYQHSVSGINYSGKPFLKKKNEVCYSDFVDAVVKEGFEVDAVSLKKSRRCSEAVCEFVRTKLNIPIFSSGFNAGGVSWAVDDIDSILSDDHVMKLVYKDSEKYSFCSMNWSYSKGNTFDSVCVVLTKQFEDLGEDGFSISGIPQSTINKLYVALTRSRGSVLLVKASQFNNAKRKYLKLSHT